MKKAWVKQNFNKMKRGKHIKHTGPAESAAEYLHKEQWGKLEEGMEHEIASPYANAR